MKKIYTKICAVILTVITIVLALPVTSIQTFAASSTAPSWIEMSTGVYNLEGTDIIATLSESTLTITGNGRMPDYTIRNYRYRPWNNKIIKSISIAETITYIGTYEFYNVKYLENVEFYLSTFVADRTSFKDLYNVKYRIKGSSISTVYYGKLPYTSLDSIEFMAFNTAVGQSYIFDNETIATTFQNSSSPSITNVYSATDYRNPWLYISQYSNGYQILDLINISDATPMKDCKVTARMFFPTLEVYQTVANCIGEYNYAFAFDMTVTRLEKYTMTNTLYDYQYVLNIADTYKALGTEYVVLQFAQTGVKVLTDLDVNPNTVTFSTNEPVTTYVLIYK